MKQLVSWNGSQVVKLWIVKTQGGVKWTWKASKADVQKAAKKLGFKVISIRAGTEKDK